MSNIHTPQRSAAQQVVGLRRPRRGPITEALWRLSGRAHTDIPADLLANDFGDDPYVQEIAREPRPSAHMARIF